MAKAKPPLELPLEQQIHMARFRAEEMLTFLISVANDPQLPHDANLWLAAARAMPRRAHTFGDGMHQPVEGTLWQLYCGELFWTSHCGRFFAYEVLGH